MGFDKFKFLILADLLPSLLLSTVTLKQNLTTCSFQIIYIILLKILISNWPLNCFIQTIDMRSKNARKYLCSHISLNLVLLKHK